jgi:exopolysaccharide biosynthesis polyprenyl glycosylphosphotransferase
MQSSNELIYAPDEISERVYSYPQVYGGTLTNVYSTYIKRAFDVIFAALLFAVLSPLMLITVIVIKVDSAGPAIFKQERLGLKGRAFVIYKFRSMRIDAEVGGPVWASKSDSRTTRIGRFIRKYRIDELPQLVNIMKGDMSFVGPRPEREYFYEKFSLRIPDFRSRLAVKPGLTGWAQVNGGYDITPAEKLKYDKEYISGFSFRMDMRILFRTFGVVLKGSGAR